MLDQLLERADAAPYQAKAEGRNRVVVWQPGSVRLREIAESV
jgi:PleD family two-component response regulator